MEEIICYKISDGSIYQDKEIAIKVEERIANRKINYYTQSVPLKFDIGDIVYISARDKIRQCKVISIKEDSYLDYDDECEDKTTVITLLDINDNDYELSYWTTKYNTDLNTQIVINFLDLCNFNYKEVIEYEHLIGN